MVRGVWCLIMLGVISASALADPARYWVFFNDKGVVPGQEMRALDQARGLISDRAMERRVRNGVFTLNDGDLPVCQSYIQQIAATGVHIRSASKWLNAVSIETTPAQLAQIELLDCVREVRRFSRAVSIGKPTRVEHSAVDSVEYGPSYAQNQLSGVPELHGRGLTGQGVLLCMLDTGFRTEHVSLMNLNYLAMRDFIWGDSIVHNEEGVDSADQHSHGTAVLSAAAGLDSNNIIGPAFGAQWMLAKTEYVPTETEVEEDYYVAGMEWADSAGAQITSSSLGYIDWYTQDQMDGRTTVVAQAVTEAQRRGILVVTAQGNERNSLWNAVISPADADSILAVGGVDSLGVLSGFSSPGPTADGRIKPDCSAQASDVYGAMAFTTDQYWRLSGTSLATPIVAGIAGLVMEAHPDWTAQQVRTAIMMSSSQSDMPDNDLGWGIVNGPAAVDYIFDSVNPRGAIPSAVSLIAFPNPANGLVTINLEIAKAQRGELVLYDVLGHKVLNWGGKTYSAGEHRVAFGAENLASGKYFLSFSGQTSHMTTPIVILK